MRRACMTILMVLMTILLPVAAGAVEAPHNYDMSATPQRNFGCAQCHGSSRSAGLKRLENLCYSCHQYGVNVGDHTVGPGDTSNIFNTVTTTTYKNLTEANKKMTSHNWVGPDNKAAAGAVAPTSGSLYKSAVNYTVSCARCHWVHSSGTLYQQNKPLLRMANDEDQMCLECHKPFNIRSHTTGTHPVRFNYASSAAKYPGKLKPVISNNKTSNLTSDLSRYLKKGRVVCSTCHKLHKADSNSASYDSYTSTMQPLASVKQGKGTLLRTDFRRAAGADPNICQNCHTYMNHNKRAGTNIQCTDCHGGHVKFDMMGNTHATPNILLINRYINYSAVVKGANVRTKSIFFSTTSGTVRNFFKGDQTGMCEICHPATSLPPTVTEHTTPADLNAGDKRCKNCHPHGGASSFTPNGAAACGTCHGRPPHLSVAGNVRYGGTQGGYAVYTAVGANEWSYKKIGASNRPDYKDETTTPHNRHSEGYYDLAVTTNYAIDCDDCHKGKNHMTQTYEDVFTSPSVNYVKSHPRPGDVVTVPIAGLFAKNFATYTSLNATDGACNNVYCHSNGAPRNAFDIYTGMVYRWPTGRYWGGGAGKISAAQGNRCSACHDAQPTTNTHLRHRTVNQGNPVMGVTIVCTDCHKSTYSLANYTSINLDQSLGIKHVNGLKDVAFDTSKYPGVSFTLSNATCTGFCHANGYGGGPVQTTKWTTPNTYGCGFCHAFPPATGAHAKHMPSVSSLLHQSYTSVGVWSTTGEYVFGCANCHPKDVTKHINGTVEVTLNKNHGGLLKSKNTTANDDTSGWSKNAGKLYCFASYCHSNGANGVSAAFKFYSSPDWYATFSGDKCAMCHGNSPNSGGKVGSPAHYNNNSMGSGKAGGHFVGVHYADIYINSGGNGKAAAGNTAFGSHGNSATATTISCNTCHFSAVTSSANDNNVMCVSCHTGGQARNPAELIASKAVHLNGAIDVAFNLIQVKSKAQLRNASYNLYSSSTGVWQRFNTYTSYKKSGSYDRGRLQFQAAMWTSGTGRCDNIACHNGETVYWNTPINSCVACHTKL